MVLPGIPLEVLVQRGGAAVERRTIVTARRGFLAPAHLSRMLQCLDRLHRLAYVVGEILDLPGPEAADILGISPALFRKRLQHARAAVMSFTRTYCGLASNTAACACHRRVPAALHNGRIRGDALDFANAASSYRDTRAFVRRVEEARWALEVHRSSHPRASSVAFARRLVQALDSHKTPSRRPL